MRPTSDRNGFTLIELLVVIGMIALLLSILIPVLNAARERAGRVKCMSNLRQIGQAIALYINDNKGKYPRGHYRIEPSGLLAPQRVFDHPSVQEPFGPAGPVNDITAAYFLLIRYRLVNAGVFVCPSTDHRVDAGGVTAPHKRSNFEDPTGATLSYSFLNPYLPTGSAQRGVRLPPKGDKELAIGADRNDPVDRYRSTKSGSTRADLRAMNSQNHSGAGQNVLYAGWHVLWQDTPFCGARRDHIYSNQSNTAGKTVNPNATSGTDSSLTPWYQDGKLEGGGINPKP